MSCSIGRGKVLGSVNSDRDHLPGKYILLSIYNSVSGTVFIQFAHSLTKLWITGVTEMVMNVKEFVRDPHCVSIKIETLIV